MVNGCAPILTMFPFFPALGLAALTLLGLALLHACHTDIRERRIANGTCLAVIFAALPYWSGVSGGHLRPCLEPLLIFLGSLVPLLLVWRARLLGGGDVKLLAALMPWMTGERLPVLLLVMVMAGAAIGIAIIGACRLRGWPCRKDVPYGLPITLGAVAALAPSAHMLASQVR